MRFDVSGSTNLLVGIGGDPPTALISIVEPYSSPSNETGYVWGLGLDWKVSERITVDIGFKRHETQVLRVDTLNLSLLFSL